MALKTFLAYLAVDTGILVVALGLRFGVLGGMPVERDSVPVLLLLGLSFVVFVLTCLIVVLTRPHSALKIALRPKPVGIILLFMGLAGLLAALPTVLMNLKAPAGPGLGVAYLAAKLLLAVIYLALIAPWVAIWVALEWKDEGPRALHE